MSSIGDARSERVKNTVDKFESSGSVYNIPITKRVRPGRSAENIDWTVFFRK